MNYDYITGDLLGVAKDHRLCSEVSRRHWEILSGGRIWSDLHFLKGHSLWLQCERWIGEHESGIHLEADAEIKRH